MHAPAEEEEHNPQRQTPYLRALLEYSGRSPARLHVPGHKGGAGADPDLSAALGERALSLDIPALTHGVDVGVSPTPIDEAQRLAALAWGAKRTWFLIGGASQGNLASGIALAHHGERILVQRNAHSSTIDALVLSGLRPTFLRPEIDPELGIAHCLTPETLKRGLQETPEAIGAWIVSPTYFGAVADTRSLADVAHAHGIPLIVDEAWGAHMAFHERLPEHALQCGADLVISSTHKMVGSLTQSAMLHLGEGVEGVPSEDVVDRAVTLLQSTSPNSLLLASLDAARRAAAINGRELLEHTMQTLSRARVRIREIPGLDVLDERIVGVAGVFGYDPMRLAVDIRGLAVNGYQLAGILREIDDINLELYGENVIVAIFGLGERSVPEAGRLIDALELASKRVGLNPDGARSGFANPPPWGELVLSPREAYLGSQEVLPIAQAAGRIAAESLASYPPGIPNVLPGERLTEQTLSYIQHTLKLGGSVRGASDRRLRTVRVLREQ